VRESIIATTVVIVLILIAAVLATWAIAMAERAIP